VEWEPVGRVAIAMALGAALGLDRELARKPAGLRTHMLVAAGASLLTEVGLRMLRDFSSFSNPSIRIDPIIIVQAVATAIGFIGGGTILRHGESDRVEGLTTAASLLLTSAIGVAVSSGLIWVALGVTILALITLRGVAMIEKGIRRHRDPSGPEGS
jgi:putative Mg2+ transporter-C (MgtC) family protein